MNRLDSIRRSQVIATLVEGSSINAAVRMGTLSLCTIEEMLETIAVAALS